MNIPMGDDEQARHQSKLDQEAARVDSEMLNEMFGDDTGFEKLGEMLALLEVIKPLKERGEFDSSINNEARSMVGRLAEHGLFKVFNLKRELEATEER